VAEQVLPSQKPYFFATAGAGREEEWTKTRSNTHNNTLQNEEMSCKFMKCILMQNNENTSPSNITLGFKW